jgi:hypothetical protein
MTTITINAPAKVSAPRGAVLAAHWFAALLNGIQALADRRAAHRRGVDRQAEAAEVRNFAHQVALEDPRFAADLYAAADRHELG